MLLILLLVSERLITDFIADEFRNGHGLEATQGGDSVGEVQLAIGVYCHPHSGEMDGTIRGKGSLLDGRGERRGWEGREG